MRRIYSTSAILAALSIVLAQAALAQAPQLLAYPNTTLSWPGTTGYDPAIPTPKEVFGHDIGERHTIPSQVVQYFEAVAEASDRVTLRQHGLTYEGRPLIHAIVTTPERQGQLDELQAEHVALVTSGGNASLANAPAVAYMGYSIHGNEASGTEAAILTLYHLAAGRGPAVDSVLSRVVTIIDPMFNPDGRDRFTDWANRNRGAVATTDPQDREHNEPWPGGRTNHYWFDLNRDWLPAVHPESKARLGLFYAWRPQVLTDYHEMGSDATYFFQPGIPSRTNPLTPPNNQVLTGRITDYAAAGLDRIGSLYYTRESFDDFYYGKGSTYPDVNGAVGILFEQASSRALDREIPGGTISYAFSVRNQLTASLGTLQGIAAIKDDLLAHSRAFYQGSSAFAKTLGTRAYVIPLGAQRTRATEFARLMQRHQVQVFPTRGEMKAGGKTYAAGEALVIPTDQPQARFINAVLEPNTEFIDSLFYDVSTWDLPLAYGLEMHRMTSMPKGDLGAAMAEAVLPKGDIIGETNAAAYAYVIPWRDYGAASASYRLAARGIHARIMHNPFQVTVDGRQVTMPRGSLVVPIQQPYSSLPGSVLVSVDSVRAVVRRMTEEYGVDAYAVSTGLTPAGPDLGGRSTTVLREPKIALLVGEGTSSYNAGEAWHLLSERLKIPVSLIEVDRVGKIDLDRYTHIAMTGGRYGDLDLEALKKWVTAGGTLVASSSAADWAVDKELVKLKEAKLDVDSLVRKRTYAELEDARGAQVIGGAIMTVALDTTHPVAYGLSPKLGLFRQEDRFYELSKTPGANVGTYAADPLASGYLSRERREQAGGKAAVVVEDSGRGHVVLIFDDPLFRGFFRGSERLWLNAVMQTWE